MKSVKLKPWINDAKSIVEEYIPGVREIVLSRGCTYKSGAYRVKPKIQVMLQREILPNFRRGELRLAINTEVEKKFDFPFMYVDLEPVIRHFQ